MVPLAEPPRWKRMLPRLRGPVPWARRPRGRGLGVVVSYTESGGFCVPLDASRRPAAQRILAGRTWEPATLQALVGYAGAGDVVHAGTFFGDGLPALSRACPGMVWAFEPSPENWVCASVTIALNGLTNVRLTQAALSAEAGVLSFETYSAEGKSLGGASRVIGGGGLQIQAVAIDDVVPSDREVGLIHLDVEGHEPQALAGGLQTIRRCRPTLVLETVPPDRWMTEHLPTYRAVERVEANTVLVDSAA